MVVGQSVTVVLGVLQGMVVGQWVTVVLGVLHAHVEPPDLRGQIPVCADLHLPMQLQAAECQNNSCTSGFTN